MIPSQNIQNVKIYFKNVDSGNDIKCSLNTI